MTKKFQSSFGTTTHHPLVPDLCTVYLNHKKNGVLNY